MADWRDRIVADPNVCHGKACIRGTRVLVSVVLATLADGGDADGVARRYQVSPEDIRAALAYAAEVTRERIVDLPAA